MTVVDASVAVKWLSPEPGAAAAQRLLDSGERLVGPAFVRIEVAAAIARKARFGEIDPRDAEAAALVWSQAVADGILELASEDVDLPRALALAIGMNHPLQDCIYLALAERLGATLVTGDEKFAAKTAASGVRVTRLE